MKEDRQRVTERRTGFICTELPFMAAAGLTVAQERRHIQDRRAGSVKLDWLDEEDKDQDPFQKEIPTCL